MRSLLRALVMRMRDQRSQRNALESLFGEWESLASRCERIQPSSVRRLLFVPGDPWSLVGSKGDEAMMLGVVNALVKRGGVLEVGIITATPEADAAARRLGFTPMRVWGAPTLEKLLGELREFAPSAALVLGADIMDGFYSPHTTVKVLAIADVLVRSGIPSSVLGFSFNENPDSRIRGAFTRANAGGVRLNVRDTISLERLGRFVSVDAKLVADAAFLLDPDSLSSEVLRVATWADDRRRSGSVVLGVNLNPILASGIAGTSVESFAEQFSRELRMAVQGRAVSLCLLSHDYRGDAGDNRALDTVYSELADELGPAMLYPSGRYSAAELKAMAGCTDAVLTGRMHLAIAALGMGKPVAAITYQGKFEGLFAHFDLPSYLSLDPNTALRTGSVSRLVRRLLDERTVLARQVIDRLPRIGLAAHANLEGLGFDG
jgi:colanic acid/amylovoran biosynthesis protein